MVKSKSKLYIKLFCFLFAVLSILPVYAGSINPAVYRTMTPQSYRANYNRQVKSGMVPYWQSQANFTTRNRTYQNYSNYTRYMNNVNQNNYSQTQYRGMY